MTVPAPHYLLLSDVKRGDDTGHWRFTLREVGGAGQIEVNDIEPGVHGERLDLLTVVRALEALDQPSRITLVGCGTYVRHGMRYGLSAWRRSSWRWEFFGRMVPVKNGDLWQRVDCALQYHKIEAFRQSIDWNATPPIATDASLCENGESNAVQRVRAGTTNWLKYMATHILSGWRWTAATIRRCRQRTHRSQAGQIPSLRVG